MNRRLFACFFALLMLVAVTATAHPQLPALFSDHMVLQRDMPVPVWGTADPDFDVTVEFAGQKKETKADGDGKWRVTLDPLKASKEPATMKVMSGDHGVEVKDILVGEVWICSGQSNMEWTVNACRAKEDADTADFPMIRQIKVPHVHSDKSADNFKGQWVVCSPQTAGSFTAVGFFFARDLIKELDCPIGLINSSWGGTRVEPWTPPCGFAGVEELKELATKPATGNHQTHTRIYHSMIHPLIPYAIRGAIWYQGESNGGEHVSYFHKKKALITGWRKLWEQGDFPFYFVQLANFRQPNKDPKGGDGWARVREAQTMTLDIPNTGMAVIIDIGEARDIHPKNKQDVGGRLALWALAKDYGKKDLVHSGPLYKSMKVEGDKIRLSFDHVGSGLMVGNKDGKKPTEEVKNGELTWFSIADAEKKWHHAKAVIDGNTVVVSADGVKKPTAVRYAFTMNPEGCNLYNKEGLPASPFRTDDWK